MEIFHIIVISFLLGAAAALSFISLVNERFTDQRNKRVTVESESQQTISQLKPVLDFTPNLVIICTGQQIEYMNKTCLSHLGLEHIEQGKNYTITDFIHPSHRHLFFQESNSGYKELTLLSITGKPIVVEWYDTEIEYLHQPSQLIIARDITAAKQIVEANNRLLSILEETEAFISIVDENGRVSYINKSKQLLSGLDGSEGSTACISDFYPLWEGKLIRDEALSTARSKGIWKGETVFLTHSGTLLPVFQTILAHKDDDGNVKFYSTLARDLKSIRSEEEILMSKTIIQKTLEAQEKERGALAKELHDGIGQSLYFVSLGLHTMMPGMEGRKHAALFQSILEQLENAIQVIRSYTLQLRPQILEHLGLVVSIRNLIHSYQVAYPHIKISFEHQLSPINNTAIEINLYRFIQEAFNNTTKYAQATTIEISLTSHSDRSLQLKFKDNGIGFDRSRIRMGLGLRHMEERIHSLKGQFKVITEIGHGTELVAIIPL